MPGCDYANARVRGMRGRLLGTQGILDLLARSDLAGRVDFLKTTDYGEAVAAHVAREPDLLRGAERGLGARLREDLVQIDRFLRGERVRRLFRAVLAFEDGWNLKTVLRGLAAGEAPERLSPLLSPTPELGEAALAALVQQRDVAGAVGLLVTWGSPYAAPLEDALPAYRRRPDLLVLDTALDRFLFARALGECRRPVADGRLVAELVQTLIDLTNGATLLKKVREGGGIEFFISGGRLIGESRFRQCAALGEPELAAALAQALRPYFGRDRVAVELFPDPFVFDQALHEALRERMKGLARLYPLSLAVPLAFVLERQAEVRRIRLVLRGAEFGLPADQLLDLVEAG